MYRIAELASAARDLQEFYRAIHAVVGELKSALKAHAGDTPLTLVLCHRGRETPLSIDAFPVTVSSALLGELKSIPGIAVAS